ncbi:hypothetical protein HZZ02_19450, partial [Streptococcus danieliae]|nr:hypothetical protein [Streptococcus danieliae]
MRDLAASVLMSVKCGHASCLWRVRHYLAEEVSHARSPYTREPMKSITVEYRHNFPLDPLNVVRVFDHSGIKRPTGELPRIARMFAAPCLLLSAWVDGKLLGLARSLSDHAYCCYLSDLAVNKQY